MARGRRLRHAAEALREPARGFRAQELFGADLRGHRILRQPRLAQLQRQTAAARDLHRIGERLGHIGEQCRHLLRAAQVLLARIAAHAPRVGEQRAIVDAHARLVRVKLLGSEEAHVVGGDHRHAAPRGQRHGCTDVGLLDGRPRRCSSR